MNYHPNQVYEDAYNMKFHWGRWLKEDVYEYHNQFMYQFNSPVELQMGILLPIISSCLGLKTRGLWSTEPAVLNPFWMNIAVSGVGKSKARQKLISEPMEYMSCNILDGFKDCEVSHFMTAGM